MSNTSRRIFLDEHFNELKSKDDIPVYVKKIMCDKKHIKLFENETFWLKHLHHETYTPQLVERGDDYLIMTYVGENVNKKNLPADWREQIEMIVENLKTIGCSHNDIKKEEILIKDNKIYLIDFQHATKTREEFEKMKSNKQTGCSNGDPDKNAFINILGNLENQIKKNGDD